VLKTPVFVIGICVNFLSIMKSKNDNARRERGKNYTEKEKEMALTVIDR
jgi:hypothetical protein